VKAWVVQQRRRLFVLHAEIRTDDVDSLLLAEADATMYQMHPVITSTEEDALENVLE
jgi:hypothetical protein